MIDITALWGYMDFHIRKLKMKSKPHSTIAFVVLAALGASARAGEYEDSLRRLNDPDEVVQMAAYKKISAAPETALLPDVVSVAGSTTDQKLKRQLIDMLSSFRDPRVLPAIKQLTESSSDAMTRLHGVQALQRFKDEQAAAELEKIARTDPSVDVRISAIKKFARLKKKAAGGMLREIFNDPNIAVKMTAGLQLARIGDSVAYDLAKQYIKKNTWQVRSNCALIIGYVGSSADEPLLTEIANSKELFEIRNAAVYALKQLKFNSLTEAERLPFLKSSLSDSKPNVRKWAAVTLQERRGSAEVALLKEIASKADHPGREEAANALNLIQSD